MKGKQKPKTAKKALNRKLLYSIIMVTFVLLATLVVYYMFLQPNSDDWTAAIVDQLAIEPTLVNQSRTFNTTTTSMLNASGFEVKYYPGKDVTVDFYENLPSKGGKVTILRAHSAKRSNTTSIDLFTSEEYDESLVQGKYSGLAANHYISRAVFDVSGKDYFAVGPTFVTSVMRGSFSDSLIILMGCDSLNQTTMAEALFSRGAKVVIGWTKKVDVVDTDNSTIRLLGKLLGRGLSIEKAVNETNQAPHPLGATLDYYPKSAGNYIVETKKSEATSGLTFQFFLNTTVTRKRKAYIF